jgi:hypothetical protein
LVFAAGSYESHGSEALAAGERNPETAALDHNFGPEHQLLGYYIEELFGLAYFPLWH